MTPAVAAGISLSVEILRLIIKETPSAINAMRTLLAKDEPTDADFEAAKAQIAKDTFESLAPNAAKVLAEAEDPV